jgi:hypothetical protein
MSKNEREKGKGKREGASVRIGEVASVAHEAGSCCIWAGAAETQIFCTM